MSNAPGQHFLLSAKSRTLSLAKVMRMSDDEAFDTFKAIRWASTEGEPVCPDCGCLGCYEYASRPIFKCKGCGKQSRNCTCPPTMKAAEISDDEFWATDYIEAKTGSLIGSGMLDELGALGNNERFLAGADVAGLGMLAAPSAYELATGDKVDDKTKNQAELGGLGVLAATQIPKFIHSTPSVPRLAL